MSDELDVGTKLEIYKLVINRYKALISEKESHSISEIRQKVSPYTDFIRKIRDQLLSDMLPYIPQKHFQMASQRAIDYIREIKTCEFSFTFWVQFEEMEKIKIGTAMDKAILFAALLRAFESDNARVYVTKKGKSYVKYSWNSVNYVFAPETGSLLVGGDGEKIFIDDPASYSFNDLVYENYEEEE
jgi:exonuclease III